MANVYLFRLKVEYSAQKRLFDEPPAPKEIVREAISSKPSSDPERATVWHLGNVEVLDKDLLYFRIGKTTRGTIQRYDDETHDFVDEESEQAPYTHVVFSTSLQVCAIVANPRLATSVRTIANRLEALLTTSEPARHHAIGIIVAEINDPDDFISQVREADAVLMFKVTFSLPNPFDVEKDFHAPMEEYLREAGGTKGSASISGERLSPELIEAMTRSVAASGNNAVARVRPKPKSRPVLRNLRHNPATFVVELAEITGKAWKRIGDMMKKVYNNIRKL